MTPRIRKFERTPEVNRRVRIIYVLASVFFFILLVRLYYLQVLRFSYFYTLSEGNRVRLKPVRAPRGLILDRNGVVLADSKPAFHLTCIPYDVIDAEGELDYLDSINDLDTKDVKEKIERAKRENPLGNISIASDLTFDQVSQIETNLERVPGFSISFSPRRNYPYGPLLAHVVGYVGEADLSDLKKFKEDGVIFGDFVGKTGVERTLEGDVHGEDGVRRIEVDALGREKKGLSFEKPKQGGNVYLTIDVELQKEASRLLAGKVGGVFGMNPKNGEVYVSYSSPSFDPNTFARGIRVREWKRLLKDKRRPLQNRMTQGIYAPGSTIKPIFALLALDDGMVSDETQFFCSGEFFLGNTHFRCWKRGGHGDVKMRKALIESCDIYFYNLGLTAGVENLHKWCNRFGLGEYTGIDIPSEVKGIVPGKEGKKKRFGERWYDGDTVVASIGQGYFAVSPAEMAVAYSAIANGGRIVVPHLVKRRSQSEVKPEVREDLHVEGEHLRFIQESLRRVVSDLHGTGARARVEGMEVAGKTGTAQVVSQPDERMKEEELEYYKRDHAWFVGFAPARDPEICVAVLIEHGGSGGKAAAPIFRKIVEKFFEERGRK